MQRVTIPFVAFRASTLDQAAGAVLKMADYVRVALTPLVYIRTVNFVNRCCGVCVCVCVCERERERESVCVCERERERVFMYVCVCKRERERECVCVCV